MVGGPWQRNLELEPSPCGDACVREDVSPKKPAKTPSVAWRRALQFNVYKRELGLTVRAWLSGRVLVSGVIRLLSFSPLSSAARQGRSASGFAEAPASVMWPHPIVFLDPTF
jgi:hypothetical protein